MESGLILGLLLVCTSCLMAAVFRPKRAEGRFLCLLLLMMGGLSVSLQQSGAALLVVQGLLGAVMIFCTLHVLLQEVRERRRAASASRRRRTAVQRTLAEEMRRAA